MSSRLLAPSICSSNLPVTSSAAFKRPSLPSLSRFRPQRCPHYGFHSRTSISRCHRRKYAIVNSSAQLDPPPTVPINSSQQAGFGRKDWIAGIVLTLLLPFLKNKWGPLLFYKNEADEVMQRVEDAAEMLEKAADKVDKLAEDIKEELPQGQLKNTMVMVEHVAEEVAKCAHIIDDGIDKVQELEEEAEKYVTNCAASGKVSNTSEKTKLNNNELA